MALTPLEFRINLKAAIGAALNIAGRRTKPTLRSQSREAKIDVGDAAIVRISGVNGEIGRASILTRRPAEPKSRPPASCLPAPG